MHARFFRSLLVPGSLCLYILSFAAGCSNDVSGNYQMFEWAPVTGRVTLDGTPLPNAMVTFSEAGYSSSWGITDSDGRYELTFDQKQKGAAIGKKSVVIRTVFSPPEISGYTPPSVVEGAPEPVEKLLPIYHNKTILTADVVAGTNEINFELFSTPQGQN